MSYSLQDSIEFGEYNPDVLSNYSEWHTLSTHVQWQLIKKALEIRFKQLTMQYAELNNSLDLSKKPYIKTAMDNVQRQIQDLEKDKEDLYVEYSNKM